MLIELKRRFFGLAGCLLLFGLLTGATTAAETITGFHADIEIAHNGDLTVRETIAVVAEGKDIKRGIFRDFPRSYVDDDGYAKRVSFDLLSVKRNGRDEPYHTVIQNSDTRVYIGDEGTYLDNGNYTYELTYKTDRQILYFDNHDELYWNVTGNDWQWPIEAATARVTLPRGGVFERTDYFTGYAGDTGKNAAASLEDNGNAAVFATTSPLARQQGLTIIATLPKGIIDPPSETQKLIWFMRDFGHIVVGVVTLGLISLFYLFVWFRVGRDPNGGEIKQRWTLPEGMSPALVHYIAAKGRTDSGWTAISAAILNLAVKDFLVIDDIDDTPVLVPTGKGDASTLPVGEAAILKSISTQEEFRLSKSNGTSVSSLKHNFTKAIENEHRQVFYRHNTVWMVLGIVLSVLGILTSLIFNVTGVLILAFGAIFCGLVFGALVPLYLISRAVLKVRDTALRAFGLTIVGLVAAAVVIAAGWFVFLVIEDTDLWIHMPFVAVVLGIIAINVLFFSLLGAPTKLGAQMMSAVEGLRQYLANFEAGKMNLAGAPKMSPRYFEKQLPYAVALGLEQPWSDAFESWLTSVEVVEVGANRYRPRWRRNDLLRDRRIGERFGSIGHTMSGSLSSAMPVRSSSSSSSSSGSSGGGGGGGGGGGW